jgi:predicted SAM-dependent methyltransferase
MASVSNNNLQPHQFGSTTHQPSVKEQLWVEFKSWIGRKFYPPSSKPTGKYLHFGCGPNVLPGFQNLDFYMFKRRHEPIALHDLRFPLPYADGSFEGAYSEHCIEHLYASQATRLFQDLHRVLKPGAILRISVPDLEKYVSFYKGEAVDSRYAIFSSGCEAIWFLTQNNGHVSVWDSRMLCAKLREAGFAESYPTDFRQGRNPDLLVDQEDRRWESLYVEAVR